jgi:hypothetical protein
MRKKIALFPIVAFLIFNNKVLAQQSPDDMVKKFFDLYKSQGSDLALRNIFLTNNFFMENQDESDNLIAQIRKTAKADGEYRGFDILTKKYAGPNLVIFVLLVRHDRSPMTFRMTFYRPTDKWQIQVFNFDTKMTDELEEASKGYSFITNSPN